MKTFTELTGENLNREELLNIKGGAGSGDGCQTGICSIKIVTSYCDPGAVCTSGIGGNQQGNPTE